MVCLVPRECLLDPSRDLNLKIRLFNCLQRLPERLGTGWPRGSPPLAAETRWAWKPPPEGMGVLAPHQGRAGAWAKIKSFYDKLLVFLVGEFVIIFEYTARNHIACL